MLLGEEQQPLVEQVQPDDQSEIAAVKRWSEQIKSREDKLEETDFKRIRRNMDFVVGLQWAAQHTIDFDKTVVNQTLQTVNRGVASLYAKNPKVVAKRRKRLNYQIWDGKRETIEQAMTIVQLGQQTGIPVPPDIIAMLQDFQRGQMHERLVDKVCQTLEFVYQHQCDALRPDYKTQMKQLVRRVRVCGVGYIKMHFCRDYEDAELTQSETRLSVSDRAKQAMGILEKLQRGDINEDDADVDRLRTITMGLGVSPLDSEAVKVKERLVFDFPPATSIIPDGATRSLKGWIGTHWIAERSWWPVDFVNAFFELRGEREIKTDDGSAKIYGDLNQTDNPVDQTLKAEKRVKLFEVYCIDDKSSFIICEGYKYYVRPPEVVDPSVDGFWTIFPVTFNDIEVEEDCEATVFPPSDVDLIKPIQRDINRLFNSLRRHRWANRPRYGYPDGALDDEDLDRIMNAEDQEVFPLKGLQPGVEPGKVLQPIATVEIEASLYDARPLQEAALLATGMQEANIGPAQPNVTATVGTIAEQSRMSVASSDIDGLDDCLTAAARCGKQMCLQEMSQETVTQIAGIGAVWPDDPQSKRDFINEIEMEVVAASSGKPNKAVDIANWERIAPLIMQAATMPPQAMPTAQAIIRETVNRYDDKVEPMDFFPLPVPMMPQQADAASQSPPAKSRPPRGQRASSPPRGGPQQPLQPTASGMAVPLVGHQQ